MLCHIYREDSVKPKHTAQSKLFFHLNVYFSELSVLQLSIRQLCICDEAEYFLLTCIFFVFLCYNYSS
jgi:hypothetical protein